MLLSSENVTLIIQLICPPIDIGFKRSTPGVIWAMFGAVRRLLAAYRKDGAAALLQLKDGNRGPLAKCRQFCLHGEFRCIIHSWERCPSGLWCRSRKAVSQVTGPWVRIPPSPWRGAGVADQARLESACRLWRPWVRIPPSPLLSPVEPVLKDSSVLAMVFVCYCLLCYNELNRK